MSTENEGAAASPAAGPEPTHSDAAPDRADDSSSPEGRAAAASGEEDFELAEPASAAGASASAADRGTHPGTVTSEAGSADAHSAVTAAFGGAADAASGEHRGAEGDTASGAAVPKAAGGDAPGDGAAPRPSEHTAELRPVEPVRDTGSTTQVSPSTGGAEAGSGGGSQATAALPRVEPEAPPTMHPVPPPQGPPPSPPGASQTGGVPAAHPGPGHQTGEGQGAVYDGGTAYGSAQPPTHGPAGAYPPPPGAGYGHGHGHGAEGGPPGGGAPGGPEYPWNAPPGASPSGGGGGRRRPGALLAAVVAAALLAGGVGGGIGFWAADRDGSGSTTVSAGGGSEALNRSPDSVAGIANKALPSVVTIQAGGAEGAGTGTGFVFDEEGHILTNNHVVAGAADGGKLTATFSDGKSYEAQIVGRAEGYDVAVIKLQGTGDRELKPLPLGDSEKMKVGDSTIAIGAPFGLSGTVTTGIVSAQDRPVASSDGQGSEASYMNALQTDASVNPGNSGGPLLNAKGAVIGVNSAIRSGSDGGMGQGQGGSVGLGFAIPINQAKRVATQLIETGVPVYPVIGVRVNTGQSSGDGAQIVETSAGGAPVTKGGPADQAGLEPGDVITEFAGRHIDSGPTLIATSWSHEPGEKVKLTYERDGEEQTTELTLGERKGDD
ncbi:S1C family serine protease [Streptomyces oceani]|uniref:PDZ domain-containing protein n=1 Tax=Streptomyces oceani TaxID=1075402 RepID=A0A1E7JWQ3_9ACTN|nr:trypsin-like peptidase domain-containing protein [Streptomyces oceani]OEU96036.1 hypothetical protein AN216_21930 [Streptomyces oceani]